MTVDAIAFQARARTIDHLGREQIADCPTAITELWKNAYDAYARTVELHIIDGEICSAALVDDGHGMSRDEFQEKWLVLGTESKASGHETPEIDRDGLPLRNRQGQKGIGRLSAAALGPLMLLISKRKTEPFVASLIDWRLFENPFLLLEDIKIPVVEFGTPEELSPLLDSMFDRLMGNIWGDQLDSDRRTRLSKAWDLFDELEEKEKRPSTRAAIEGVLINASFTNRQLDHWPVWNGKRPHGTAMLVADIAFDLQAQLTTSIAISDTAAAKSAKERLRNTLVNFTDPYSGHLNDLPLAPKDNEDGGASSNPELNFAYGVMVWEGALGKILVSDVRTFSTLNLASLEHVVDGIVDELGVFRGRIKAFGKWLEDEVILNSPYAVPTRSDSKVGPFSIRLGTFEQELRSTTHEAGIHAKLLEQSDLYAGFLVYRDSLRVMPYGREDNDFFEIERRRGLHAGREFWSIRRLFGRVALTRAANTNLKDKAGREGIIDNKAAKVFRDIVENILKVTARRYFGSDSSIRKEILPQINANYKEQQAEDAQKKLRARKRKEFRKNLSSYLPEITGLRSELEELIELARKDILPNDETALLSVRAEVENIRDKQSQLSLGPAPSNLGALERSYKDYRSNMALVSNLIVQLRDSISSALDRIKPKSQHDVAFAELNRNAAYLHSRLRKWSSESRHILNAEQQRLSELIDNRNKAYHAEMLPLLNALESGQLTLSETLRKLDIEKEIQDAENAQMFESYLSTLRSLAESIDLENLVNFALSESAANRDEIQRLNALAQLGITVEIIGHEIEDFDGAIAEGLRKLPENLKGTEAYISIKNGHESLSDRLRFLSPLKLSGERTSQWIDGTEIETYLRAFLCKPLEDNGIVLNVSESFRRFSIFEQLPRILPIFINLLNNAVYWVARSPSSQRVILLDVIDRSVVVADSGPGVDPEDIPNLFSLFFTRKIRGGRGVGLYLSRANLAAGGHKINYINDEKLKRLPGANFIIEFNGAKYD